MAKEVHGLVFQMSPFDAQVLLGEFRAVPIEYVGPQMAALAFALSNVEARNRDISQKEQSK